MSSKPYDFAIVGGGIIGLATAWTLLHRRPGIRLLVLEKEPGWALHQTGRNSGVIHSGIYYKPGSLKARMCREGNRSLLEFCQRYGIAHEICGKVIVATEEAELPRLESLYQRARENNLSVRMLRPDEVKEVEPHVQCLAGLHIHSTGIVNYATVCSKLVELIGEVGGDLRLNNELNGIRVVNGFTILESSSGAFETKFLINCAGLQSDRVARLAGATPQARIVPFRGEYYEIKPEKRFLVRHLIYPVPNPEFPFLGVHFTRMIDSTVHAGPNAVLSFKREGYDRTAFNLRDFVETMTYPGFWRLAVRHATDALAEMYRSFSKAAFVRSLQRLVPEVRADDLVSSEAGVRAQALRPDGGLVDDFLIIQDSRAVHICNAPSPAATASLQIGAAIVASLP
jgi:L-2-hydroxyglutarate oxidase